MNSESIIDFKTHFIVRLLLMAASLVLMTSAQAIDANPQPAQAKDESAIIAGQEALTSVYPFMGYLADSEGGQYCGASLIASRWVLTAAHCFLNEDETAVDLETGVTSLVIFNTDTLEPLGTGAIQAQIERIIPHPSYDPNFETSANPNDADIALVELTSQVGLQAVLLADSGASPSADTIALIMGWGAGAVSDEEGPSDFPNNLQQSTQKIVTRASCDEVYGGGITANMLCAAGPDSAPTTDTCQGDSGGPLVVANNESFVQVGIVSFGGTETGPACGDPEAPGVYADVAAFNAFIREHTTGVQFSGDNSSGTAGTGGSSGGAVIGAPEVFVSVDGNFVAIDWTEVAGATGYTLYYAPFPEQTPILSLDMGDALFIEGELESGLAFYVAVEAYNENGRSPVFSNVESFTIP